MSTSTSTQIKDKYPSRVEDKAKMLPRRDPVVYESDFRYTGPLSEETLTDYERDGYLFLPGYFDAGIVAALRQELDAVLRSEQIRQSELAVTEPESGETRSVFAIHKVNDLFNKLSAHDGIVNIVRQILGSEIYIHQSRVNFKPGFRGKEFYWHSDFETWHAEDGMPDMRAISCSITLTDNCEFNGPLMVIPGSHKKFLQCSGSTPENHFQQSLKKQECGVPSDEQLRQLIDEGHIEIPKGPAGSVLLFECNLMHGSNGNISPYPRSNAFFVYNSVENMLEKPFAAKEHRPWYLGDNDPEIVEPNDFISEIKEAV